MKDDLKKNTVIEDCLNSESEIETALILREDMKIISNYLFKILCIDNKYMDFYYQADEEKISICDMKSSIISYIPCKNTELDDKISSLKKMFDGKDAFKTALEALMNISVIGKVCFQEDYTREDLKPYKVYEVGKYYLVSKIKE